MGKSMPHERPPDGHAARLAKAVTAAIPVLGAERLILRAPRIEDFDAYVRIALSDRGRFLGGSSSRSETWLDFAQLCATWLLRGHGLWTVESLQGVSLGFVLIGFEPGDREPEIGFMLLPEAEGKGYAEEAARIVLEFAWTNLGFTTLVSYINRENRRAKALAQRLGAVVDGCLADERDTAETCVVYRYSKPGDARNAD